MGEEEVGDLLAETLEEEKQTDVKLTEVTQKAIMPEALAGEEEEESQASGAAESLAGAGRLPDHHSSGPEETALGPSRFDAF